MPESPASAADLDMMSYLTAIPDARMRRGVRFPAWYRLLVAVLGILSRCQSLRDLERFAMPPRRAHGSAGLRAAAPAVRLLGPLPLPPGGCGGTVCCNPGLDGGPDPWWRYPGSAWIVEVITDTLMSNDRRSVRRHLFLTSVQTTPQDLLWLVRQRWSIENEWHWARNTPLGEDAHRYANRIGAPVFAFFRTVVMNLLRRGRYRSIRQGFREVAYDIQGMLAIGGVADRSSSI